MPKGGNMENERKENLKEYDDERMALFRLLPVEVVKTFTKEEMLAFLRGEDLPDSMAEKLKDFLVEEEDS